jgi:hypothetical protein
VNAQVPQDLVRRVILNTQGHFVQELEDPFRQAGEHLFQALVEEIAEAGMHELERSYRPIFLLRWHNTRNQLPAPRNQVSSACYRLDRPEARSESPKIALRPANPSRTGFQPVLNTVAELARVLDEAE